MTPDGLRRRPLEFSKTPARSQNLAPALDHGTKLVDLDFSLTLELAQLSERGESPTMIRINKSLLLVLLTGALALPTIAWAQTKARPKPAPAKVEEPEEPYTE